MKASMVANHQVYGNGYGQRMGRSNLTKCEIITLVKDGSNQRQWALSTVTYARRKSRVLFLLKQRNKCRRPRPADLKAGGALWRIKQESGASNPLQAELPPLESVGDTDSDGDEAAAGSTTGIETFDEVEKLVWSMMYVYTDDNGQEEDADDTKLRYTLYDEMVKSLPFHGKEIRTTEPGNCWMLMKAVMRNLKTTGLTKFANSKRLHTLRFGPNKRIDDVLNELEDIKQVAERLNYTIEEDLLKGALMSACTMHRDYRGLVMELSRPKNADKTYAECVDELLVRERNNLQGAYLNNNMYRERANKMDEVCPYYLKGSCKLGKLCTKQHPPIDRMGKQKKKHHVKKKGKPMDSKKPKGECFNCGSKDHWARECPKPKKVRFKQGHARVAEESKYGEDMTISQFNEWCEDMNHGDEYNMLEEAQDMCLRCEEDIIFGEDEYLCEGCSNEYTSGLRKNCEQTQIPSESSCSSLNFELPDEQYALELMANKNREVMQNGTMIQPTQTLVNMRNCEATSEKSSEAYKPVLSSKRKSSNLDFELLGEQYASEFMANKIAKLCKMGP